MPFLHHDQIVHFFMIRNLRNYACSLYFNLQASPQMGMPFDKFTQLTLTQKEQKLIFAFKKISIRAQHDRNIYKSLRNFFRVNAIYSDMLQVICELRYFVSTLLDDDDIETKPACHNKDPSIFGIEFLSSDFEILLDVIVQSLENGELRSHAKCDQLFKKAHSLYNLIKAFEKKYR